jgi:hypothetical protein
VLAILEQLQSGGAYYGDANTLGLFPLISELQSTFTLFQQLLRQRDRKSLLKPAKTFRRVRRDLEASYYPMVELIDAGAALNTPSAFATFINDMNPEIEHLNAEFNPVRTDISECEPEPIRPQAYTGLPLTPSPVVLFKTPHDGTVRLEPGRDYNLAFRNNTEVGNAECTIVGKGKYRGRKTVTFVIVRPYPAAPFYPPPVNHNQTNPMNPRLDKIANKRKTTQLPVTRKTTQPPVIW